MKKIKKIFVICNATVLATLAFFAVGCRDDNNVINARHREIEVEVDATIKKIEHMMWANITDDNHPIKYLDEIISECSDESEKPFIINTLAEKFLSMQMSLDDQVKAKGSFENYLDFVNCILWRQCQVGVTDDERIKFFFKALENYEKYATMAIPGEMDVSYADWRKMDRLVMCRRSGFVSGMQFMSRHLFDFYLKEIDDDKKEAIRCRFSDFRDSAIKRIDELEKERLKNRRTPTW